jgi:hypothetical protein
MRAIVSQPKQVAIYTTFSLFALILTVHIASAADQAKKPAAKSSAKINSTQSTKRQPAQTKSSPPVLTVVSEDIALATFDAFTIEWMKKLEQTEEFHRTQARISQSSDGFSAEYTGYLPHRYIHVKKTEATDTPYVGILTYYERKLRCNAKTKDEALKGPFDQVETSQVSEIFRFTKGKWVY